MPGSSSTRASATVSGKTTTSRAMIRPHQNRGPASPPATAWSRAGQIRSRSHSRACSHHAHTTAWDRANTRTGSAPAVAAWATFGQARCAAAISPLVVVLSHDSCGAIAAVGAAADGGQVPAGFVRDVVERVTPSVLAARAAGRYSGEEVLHEHIRHTVDLLLERSRVLAERVAAGRLSYNAWPDHGTCARRQIRPLTPRDGERHVEAARAGRGALRHGLHQQRQADVLIDGPVRCPGRRRRLPGSALSLCGQVTCPCRGRTTPAPRRPPSETCSPVPPAPRRTPRCQDRTWAHR